MTNIGENAFYGCSSLTSIEIPNNVKSIGENAFSGCYGLTSVSIGNSVKSIGGYAFEGCSKLTSIEIPNSVTSIGDGAFVDCSSLAFVTIPNSVTSIGNYAFAGCSDLTSIDTPNSVTIIGENTFSGCSNLTSITLSKNLSIIKKQAFYGCSNLESITIPASVEFIYQEAFAECSKLKEVKALPEEPPFLYANSFSNYDITLKVPESAASKYMSTEPWNNFTQIQTLDGNEIEKEQCATPTIAIKDGKLSFSCETEDVTFCYSVTPPSQFNGEGNDVNLSTKYTISVYAKKEGYENSETVTKEIEVGGMMGDMNGDGVLSVTDVGILITKILEAE